MNLGELAEWGSKIQHDFGPKDAANAALVLESLQTGRPDVKRAAKILVSYARETAEAKTHRALGNIELAMRHEARAERLYEKLPRRARW